MASTQAAPGVDKAGATAAFAASPIQGGPQPEAQEKTDAEKQEITNEQEHVHQQQQYQHTAALQRQVTPRAWGEQTGGEPVDVDRAMQEFALARQETRRSARSGGQRSGLAGGWGVGRAPTRGTQLGEDPQGQDVERAEGEKGQDEFDLEKWILTRQAQAQESGVDAAKPLGMIWRNVDVLAPSSGGGMFVKTLPKAIINTIYKDPWAVACKLVPALHKLEFWSANTGKVPLLQNHSGVLKAGEMLLVLGRPGSGCSTMLRAVTSNTPPPLERTGKISYGGFTPEEIQRKFRGEIIFVDEDDIHFPTMTVAQTLRFALMTKVPRSMMRLSGESRKEFIKSVRKLLLDMFGISHVSDTVVGDAAVRGVSGGEVSRTKCVTDCMEYVADMIPIHLSLSVAQACYHL